MSLKQWNIIHSLAILTGLIIFHVTGLWWPVLILACISLILLWSSQWYTISHLKPAGGIGNLITLFKYILIIIIVFISGLFTARIIGLFFIVPVVLDGLDGFWARRSNQISKFGALFDLESDSLFVALAGLLLYSRHITGAWLLPAVYLRYVYVLVITLLQLSGIPEKRTRFGPSIAVIMFISLIAVFIYPTDFTIILLYVAAGMVILSFAYSFMGVISQRRIS